uniref:neuronal acetylcholine receptor subunit non-alpha-3-like isoform X1 n=1 Tax=Anopheles coluzzii TaxID=1518534 RepID=UPI0020FFE3D8|nr:neuronal acetylcholine receptor subunit non-alpha-3-like isoform X1 [Anopheles coluzzii]
MANILSFIYLPLLVAFLFDSASSINCDKKRDNVQYTIKQHLFCNGYDPKIRPAKSEFDSINITTYAVLYSFDISEYRSVMSFQVNYYMRWQDSSLAWNASDWSNITTLNINNDEIWSPQFENINSDYEGQPSVSCLNPDCLLRVNGYVSCSPVCRISAKCSSDYSRWPFNTLVCRMWFTNRDKELVDEVNFLPVITYLPSNRHLPTTKWCVTSISSNKTQLSIPGATSRTVEELEFNLEHSPHLTIAIIYLPAFALSLLNIFVCLLDSRVKEKIVIPLICMIFHFQLLQQMSNPTPEIPGVVLFIIASMILTFLLFVSTLINRWLHGLQSTPPNIVIRSMRAILSNRLMNWILKVDYLSVGQKTCTIINNDERLTLDWVMFVKLVDRFILAAYVIIYLLLFWIYIPLQHTHNRYAESGGRVCAN